MQWLQDQNQSNVDNNLNIVRREANRHFGGGISESYRGADKSLA